MNRIYLDHNATTPLAPSVLEAMVAELVRGPRNPSSIHTFGQEAKKTLVHARATIAHFLHVKPHEILFTSSGTESLNLLIRGLLPQTPCHILTTDLDHPCIYETLQSLPEHEVTFLSPGLSGAPSSQQIEAALRPTTRLIVLSAVNSETGVKLDLEGVAQVAQTASIPLVIDGVALLGKEPFTIPSGVTAMGFSGHKIHGPKGTGFAFLRSKTKLTPLLTGGSQEHKLRAGTENLPGIVGLAEAISLLEKNQEAYTRQMQTLRDRFEHELKTHIPQLTINGSGPRVVNTSNICFPNIDGESLLIHLDMEGIAASHATACSSGALEISRVLLSMGIPREKAASSLRFSLSRTNTEEDILRACSVLTKIVNGAAAACP